MRGLDWAEAGRFRPPEWNGKTNRLAIELDDGRRMRLECEEEFTCFLEFAENAKYLEVDCRHMVTRQYEDRLDKLDRRTEELTAALAADAVR